MSSGAAQLPSHRGGVMGLPSAADAATRASFGCPSGGRRRRAVQDVRTPATPFVALFASAVRHADGRPSNWSGGRPVSARPVSMRPVSLRLVSTRPGVIRGPGRTRVRCPRPLQPRWIRNTSVRRDRPRLVHRVRRVAVVGERLGRRCPNRAWRAKDGPTLAVRGSHEARRQTWRCFAGVQAAAPRSPPGRPGELVQGQVPVGWWGSRGGAGAPKSPQVRAGRVAGVLADHGLDREVVTTLGGRCAGGGPVSSGAGGPIRFSGEQTAAAARPRYVRSAVR
jgi:hypothetical protein